ncbi:transposase [Neobacillus bataviensis]|uniref:transposase n=1 Tax=Neobacillus bataviensis TaxID=220685 RepID=UPI001CBCFE46|nr:transposase [Neobacillus bataviensis]
MAKKGTKFQSYTEEFRRLAVERYINGDGSYLTLSKELGLPSPTPLKTWVKKYEEGNQLTDQRGKLSSTDNPLIGRPKTKFENIEQERDYYKAQVDYLKKQYPNLHGEVKSKKH